MHRYEYKVIPAPGKGLKAKGLKSPEARFAYALETAMNELGAEGWTYLRADILPSEERQGLTSSHTVYRPLLVFQRPLDPGASAPAPLPMEEADAPADEAQEEIKKTPETSGIPAKADSEPEAEIPDTTADPAAPDTSDTTETPRKSD
ncbi:hypothetical protein [Roseovarius nubinhibens]|uniref:DUF4177 domain-containing protein n=1 Tax=Roseovarius nubinhibens TaxID=314263 RepID=A0A348W7W5_9RHOB|nr:hypothetical protein [Roseovarius nubinhibens]|tara:strand:+ start:1944 stop:2387 length:444 start_codon:yes stop_codon:yes gene_type:complete